MSFLTIGLRVLAMLAGTAMIGSQVIQNIDFLGWANVYTGIGLAAIALPIAMAIAVPVAEHSWRSGLWSVLLCASIALLGGISHTVIVALERGVHAREQQAAARSNYRQTLAQSEYDRTLARVGQLEAMEAEPCDTIRRNGTPPRECVAARGNTADARLALASARKALEEAGAPIDQAGMAKRFGHTAALIDTFHPLALPVAVEMGGLALIGFAFHRGRARPKAGIFEVTPLRPLRTQDRVIEELRRIREAGGDMPSVREVARLYGVGHGTAQRALSHIRAA